MGQGKRKEEKRVESRVKQIKSNDDLKKDLAGRYRMTRSEGVEDLEPALVDADFQKLMRDGYVVIERLLSDEQIDAFRTGVEPLLHHTGRTSFEGARTQRVYDVFSKTRALDALTEHPRILALLDRLFLPNYLLSQAQIINILPGEDAQLLHHDDASYPFARPRPPLGAATVWAIDEFTAENGATSIIPGSHLWDQQRKPRPEEVMPCVMPAGSVVFFLGTTWHGGGANHSDRARLAATCQYCEPYLRQQENFLLEISRETALELSENLLRMIGYSIHPPFYGMVNGMHPKRLLEPEGF
jgi:ectoine hydroxylase-related dioxygenase (phytanoyl-CoA dioxygenase family)